MLTPSPARPTQLYGMHSTVHHHELAMHLTSSTGAEQRSAAPVPPPPLLIPSLSSFPPSLPPWGASWQSHHRDRDWEGNRLSTTPVRFWFNVTYV